MFKGFDDNQQKAIHSLNNTVVTAGAGSGKTSVLAARFVWLLKTQNVNIDEILTLTFTNKASAEMYEKIYQLLKLEPDESLLKHLSNFHKAQISTIDSFSAQVVRNAPSLFGLTDDFSSDDEALEKLTHKLALDFYLAHSGRKSVQAIVGKNGLAAFCTELLGRVALEFLSLARTADFPALLQKQYEEIERILPNHFSAFEGACAKLCGPGFSTVKTVMDNRANLEQAPRLHKLVSISMLDEAKAFLNSIHLRKPSGKETAEKLVIKTMIEEVRANAKMILQIMESFGEREILEDLFSLLDLFQEDVNAKKRGAKLVSFKDVAEMAVRALLENKPLREFYKHKYRFIMIDEFQDNNHLQKELLYILAEKYSLSLDRVPSSGELEPQKLFFVGDEKQSIYGFRGAEVDVFKALKDELLDHGGDVITLSKNYRSRPGLISFYNRVFAKVMARPSFDFEAEYSPLEPALEAASGPPSIFLFYKAYEDADEEADYSAAESEAFALASFIKETVERGTLSIEKEGAQRPARYGDFAVLLRSTGNQIIYERMFRRRGVPYTTQNIRSLFLEPPVNDIYALLQTALHPEDRVAYATLLRSPFVRISDAALLAVLEAGKPPFAPISLSPEDNEKFAAGRERWEFIRERIDRVNSSVLVFHAWYTFGYRFFIMQNPSAAMYLEYYDYLFAVARRADSRNETLEEFLSWVRGNLGRYEKLEEIELPKQEEESVQIMTIHKAKGLEFPIVVCANMGNRGRNRERNALCSFSKEFGITVNLGEESWFAKRSGEEEEKRELAELKRLLYVALTRAQSHLVLSGTHNRNNRGEEKALLTMLFLSLGLAPEDFSGLASPDYQSHVIMIKDLTEKEAFREAQQSRQKDFEIQFQKYAAIKSPHRVWRRSEYSVSELNEINKKRYPVEDYGAQSFTLPALSIDSYLKTDAERARWGTLVHFVLNQKLLGRFRAELVPFPLHSGFGENIFPKLLEEAVALADGFLSSEWGKLFLKAEEKETEFPFLYRYTHQSFDYYIRGAVDLYFTALKRVFVIDFKTDRSLNRLDYDAQLGIYGSALAEMTGKPVTALLYSLRDNRTFALQDAFDLDGLFAFVEKTP